MIKTCNKFFIDYAVLSRRGIPSAEFITSWIEENISQYQYSGFQNKYRTKMWWVQYSDNWGLYVHFKKNEDAAFFKLRWGGEEYIVCPS